MGNGVLSPEVKRPGREADHSPSPSVEFYNTWSCISSSLQVFMAWYLVKHRTVFHPTFTIIVQNAINHHHQCS